jgi:hypothetical protein
MLTPVSMEALHRIASLRLILSMIVPLLLLYSGYLQRESTAGDVLICSGVLVGLVIGWLEHSVNKLNRLVKCERKGTLTRTEMSSVNWSTLQMSFLIGRDRANMISSFIARDDLE